MRSWGSLLSMTCSICNVILRANQIGVSCGLSIACVNWSAFHLVTYFHCSRQHWMEQTKTVTFGMAGNSWFGSLKSPFGSVQNLFISKKSFSEVLSKFLQLEAGPVVLFLEPLGDSWIDSESESPPRSRAKTSSWECTTILYGAGHACNLSNICRVTGLSDYSKQELPLWILVWHTWLSCQCDFLGRFAPCWLSRGPMNRSCCVACSLMSRSLGLGLWYQSQNLGTLFLSFQRNSKTKGVQIEIFCPTIIP